jgi:SAM-dependent methyltransferase
MAFVNELLCTLPRGAAILDIGSGRGSFDTHDTSFTVVRTDLERQAPATPNFVQADAARLPFADCSFDLIVSNHSLEHFDDLAGALREIGRVVRSDGAPVRRCAGCYHDFGPALPMVGAWRRARQPFLLGGEPRKYDRTRHRFTICRYPHSVHIASVLEPAQPPRSSSPATTAARRRYQDILTPHRLSDEAFRPFPENPCQCLFMDGSSILGTSMQPSTARHGPTFVCAVARDTRPYGCCRSAWLRGDCRSSHVPMSAVPYSESLHQRQGLRTPAWAAKLSTLVLPAILHVSHPGELFSE